MTDLMVEGLPLWFFKMFALLVGAAFGSFANVVIYRVPNRKVDYPARFLLSRLRAPDQVVRKHSPSELACPACKVQFVRYQDFDPLPFD